jgi:hypothetical protein
VNVCWQERHTGQMPDMLLPDDGAVSLRAGIGGAIRLGACERPYAEDPYPFLDYTVEIRGGGRAGQRARPQPCR